MDTPLTHQIAEAILLYLDQHPASADTLEGVHHWWIDSDELGASLSHTLVALQNLESQRKMERISLGDRQLWRKARASMSITRH